MTVQTVDAEIERDRYGRPLITPPNGGKPKAYTRATTLADTLDDRYNLEKWLVRTTAIGLSERPDLLLAVSAHKGDKDELNKICDKAKEAGKGSTAATTGTALHALTEIVDRGEELPTIPDTARADLEAYRQAIAPLKVKAIEQFVVLDDLQVAGTFDRLVYYQDRHYIADLKTGGNVEFAYGSIAIQLALYSRGDSYDPASGTRTPMPADIDQEWAIVIHLPAGEGRCQLKWINIGHGWAAAELAMRVRAYRRHAKKGLAHDFA